MESDTAFEKKLSFKAFLSHAYNAEELNTKFFKLFNKVANVQFEVDIGSKNLNVTRLEIRLRDCDAFVGLYPFPENPKGDSLELQAQNASKYFRLEMELAARARLPSIIFYEKRLEIKMPQMSNSTFYTFRTSEIIGKTTTAFQNKIETAFKEFCNRLKPEIEGRTAGFIGRQQRTQIGMFLPQGRGGYSKDTVKAIKDIIGEFPHSGIIDFGWPVSADATLFSKLDSLDWIIVDVGKQTVSSGILGIIHSRFIPSIRLNKVDAPIGEDEWTTENSIGRLFGKLEVGYRKDIVYWRNDIQSLRTQLLSRIEIALRPPNEQENIQTIQDALTYFRLANKKSRIFVSYAGSDLKVVEKFVAMMRGHFPTVFDYKDRGKSLPPGSPWRDEIKKSIVKAHFGVIFISKAYKDSGYCKWEKNLLVDEYLSRGLTLFPVLLEGAARDMPTGLEDLQTERFHDGDITETVADRLINEMMEITLKNR